MQNDFDPTLALVLRSEGGYVNDPNDKGGPTNKGITLATARADISPSMTIAQLKALSTTQAGIVYRREYWDRCMCDKLAAGVDYTVMDYAVNSGPARVIKCLQELCGLPSSGVMSAAIVTALDGYDAQSVVTSVNAERLAYMKSLSSWAHFGAGWTNRVNGVRVHSLAMAKAGDTVPLSAYADQYIQQAVDLPTGKAIPAQDVLSQQAATGVAGIGGAYGFAAWATAHHLGAYVGMAVAFGMVGLTAYAITALQSRLNATAETPVLANVPPLAKKA